MFHNSFRFKVKVKKNINENVHVVNVNFYCEFMKWFFFIYDLLLYLYHMWLSGSETILSGHILNMIFLGFGGSLIASHSFMLVMSIYVEWFENLFNGETPIWVKKETQIHHTTLFKKITNVVRRA